VACGGPRRQELRPHRGLDRPEEVVESDVGERPLDVAERDGVERDVDAPGASDHVVHEPIDGLLVERIQDGGLRPPAGIPDLARGPIELLASATAEEDRGPAPPIGPPPPWITATLSSS